MGPVLICLEDTIQIRGLRGSQKLVLSVGLATHFVALPFDPEVFGHLDELRKSIWAQQAVFVQFEDFPTRFLFIRSLVS